ncbi:MAG: hypothetical protein V1772_14120, partial [Chloroflexota bacterium]
MSNTTEVTSYRARGAENTDETLRLAKARADALGIRHIVVASYTGFVGLKAAGLFQGYNLVVVAGVYGFREPNVVALPPEARAA